MLIPQNPSAEITAKILLDREFSNGTVRPCSQFWSVVFGTFNAFAAWDCDNPLCSRQALSLTRKSGGSGLKAASI